MTLGSTTLETLLSLPDEAKTRIVFGGERRPCREPVVAALLLGCGTAREMTERAVAAASLHKAGLAPLLIPTGAVCHPAETGDATEAEFMASVLRKSGIPDSSIFIENEAWTTVENMLYGQMAIIHALHWTLPKGPFPVCIVTSATHMRRALAIADNYLPRTAQIFCHVPEETLNNPSDWTSDAFWTAKVDYELRNLKAFVDIGEIEDIEF